MGLFSKDQKEWRTHSWKNKFAFAKDMHKAKKQMTKTQYAEYQERIKQNIAVKVVDEHMRSKGATVVKNPHAAKLRKFVIG
jgi:hypothetical protein